MSSRVKTSGIYGLKNSLNGKWYIGQSVGMEERHRNHLKTLGKGCHFNAHLQAAVFRYGIEAFEFHALELVVPEMLDVREKAWIAYYESNTAARGYNKNCGGQKSMRHSPETRAKISAAHKGKTKTAAHLAAISAGRTGTTHGGGPKISKAMKGRKFTEEHKQKISAANKGRPAANKGVPMSEQQKAKIGASQKWRTVTPQQRAHLSRVMKGRPGRTPSPAERIRMSLLMKERFNQKHALDPAVPVDPACAIPAQ